MTVSPLLTLLAFALSACVAPPQAATPRPEAEWTSFGKSEAAEILFRPAHQSPPKVTSTVFLFRTVFRVDTAEGQRLREVWTGKTTVALEGGSTATVAATDVETEVDCDGKLLRFNGKQTLYADDGSVIESVPGNPDAPWQSDKQASGTEDLVTRMCESRRGT